MLNDVMLKHMKSYLSSFLLLFLVGCGCCGLNNKHNCGCDNKRVALEKCW